LYYATGRKYFVKTPLASGALVAGYAIHVASNQPHRRWLDWSNKRGELGEALEQPTPEARMASRLCLPSLNVTSPSKSLSYYRMAGLGTSEPCKNSEMLTPLLIMSSRLMPSCHFRTQSRLDGGKEATRGRFPAASAYFVANSAKQAPDSRASTAYVFWQWNGDGSALAAYQNTRANSIRFTLKALEHHRGNPSGLVVHCIYPKYDD
jgi:hypothetical protein